MSGGSQIKTTITTAVTRTEMAHRHDTAQVLKTMRDQTPEESPSEVLKSTPTSPLEELKRRGDVKRKIIELENTKFNASAPAVGQQKSLTDIGEKIPAVKEVVKDFEHKYHDYAVESMPFKVRPREPSPSHVDESALERQILTEVDLVLEKLVSHEPPTTEVKLSPVTALEKRLSDADAPKEEICEKVCLKRKMFEVAKDGSDQERTGQIIKPIGVEEQTVKDEIHSLETPTEPLLESSVNKPLNVIDMPSTETAISESMPNVKDVVKTFEEKFAINSLQTSPFPVRKNMSCEERKADLSCLDKQILDQSQEIIEELAGSARPTSEVTFTLAKAQEELHTTLPVEQVPLATEKQIVKRINTEINEFDIREIGDEVTEKQTQKEEEQKDTQHFPPIEIEIEKLKDNKEKLDSKVLESHRQLKRKELGQETICDNKEFPTEEKIVIEKSSFPLIEREIVNLTDDSPENSKKIIKEYRKKMHETTMYERRVETYIETEKHKTETLEKSPHSQAPNSPLRDRKFPLTPSKQMLETEIKETQDTEKVSTKKQTASLYEQKIHTKPDSLFKSTPPTKVEQTDLETFSVPLVPLRTHATAASSQAEDYTLENFDVPIMLLQKDCKSTSEQAETFTISERKSKPTVTESTEKKPVVTAASLQFKPYSSNEEFDKPKVTEVKPLAPLVPLTGKTDEKDIMNILPIPKPEDKPKSPLDVTKPTTQTYSSDESDEEFDKPKVTEVKPLAPLVPLTGKPEEKGAMDILPISKPEDKPKSPLDVTKPTPQTYSSDESDEEFDKPKVTEVKPLAPLVPLTGKPEEKGAMDILPISKPEDKPKSPVNVTEHTPQKYSSDESDEEFDKPKVTEMKPLAPLVPLTGTTEEKGAMDILPISKLEDKPKSPPDVTKSTPQTDSSDESDEEFDKPKATEVKPLAPLVPLTGKPEEKDIMNILPIPKPEDKPKSPLDVIKPAPQTDPPAESGESDEEYDKPKATKVKALAPLVPLTGKPEETGAMDILPISKPEDKPKSPLDVIKPTPQTYSSDESDEEFDKPKATEIKPLAPLVPLTGKPEEKGAMDILPISKLEDKPKSPLDVTEPKLQTYSSDESDEELGKAKVTDVDLILSLNPIILSGGINLPVTDATISEDVQSDCERFPPSTSVSHSRDLLDSCSSLDSLERSSSHPVDKLRKEKAVAYFVNLEEGKKSLKQREENIKKALANKKQDKDVKSYVSSVISRSKSSPKRTQLKTNIQHSSSTKVSSLSPSDNAQKRSTNFKQVSTVPGKQKKQFQKDGHTSASTIKTTPSRLKTEVRSNRSVSPRTQPVNVNVGLSEDNSHSRSTTPRPRTRTDVTAIPHNATLRTFSPTPSRPKADYSHVTSAYAQTRKSEKKITAKKTKTKSITISSESSSEEVHRKRLATPTSTVMHRYMQPTLAHSLRYGTQSTSQTSSSKPTDTATAIATPLRSNSPGLATIQTKGKQYLGTTMTTPTGAQRRYVRTISKEERPLNFKSSLTNLKKDSLTNSKESIKSTEKPYLRKTKPEKAKAVIAHSEHITVTKIQPKTSKELSNVLNKTNQNKIKHKIDRTKDNITAPTTAARTKRSSLTLDANVEDRKITTRSDKATYRSKVPISVASSSTTTRSKVTAVRGESKLGEVRPQKDNKEQAAQPKKSKPIKIKKGDVRVQKKLKDSINESNMTGSGNTSASGSLSSVRKNTRNTTNVKKIDKDVANLRLLDKSTFATTATTSATKISKISAIPARTTVVKVHQEPVATTAIVSTVIIDDDAEITRSFRSTESTKSSTSSSGSRKVLTSEVFTKTFGPDKPFEVIYRQPDTDLDSMTTSIVRPPSTEQRCVSEFDVSFIDTTDSSLSDSVALPMFNTEQDRLLAASPGSPKATRSPLALIEETLRRQQVTGYAVDPALQMQFGAAGLRMGSISPTSSRNSHSEQNETPKETIEEKFVLDEDSFRNIGDHAREKQIIFDDRDKDEKTKLIDFDEDIDNNKDNDFYIDSDADEDDDYKDTDDDDDEDRSRKAGRVELFDMGATIRKEATVLIDNVLEESVNIITNQQQRQKQQEQQTETNGYDSLKHEYNSESENYAITCDDIGGLDVVKSPTIESMSGKSFDDNMSFTDEQWHATVTATTIGVAATTATTNTTTALQQQQLHDLMQFKDDYGPMGKTELITMTTTTTAQMATTSRAATTLGDAGGSSDNGAVGSVVDSDVVADAMTKTKGTSDSKRVKEDPTATNSRRIEHKFEKLTTHFGVGDIDEQASAFDANFDTMVHDDEISNLQSDFSKMSWDDSVSPTTNTLGDIGLNTPDNDIQDIAAETGFEFAKSSETTPVPTSVSTTSTVPTGSDAPTPKPRVAKSSSPVRDIIGEYTTQPVKSDEVPSTTDSLEILPDLSISTPVPRPRLQIKPTDSFKNLAALAAAEHSDSVSLRSLDMTEDFSKTDDISTEISIKSSHARDYPTTTTITTASEDRTESLEPTSEISVDDADADVDTEKSEVSDGRSKTSFYIGESSRNVIKTTPTRPEGELEAPEALEMAETESINGATIEAEDVALMKEISVDSDESTDAFKEYVTMKRETDETGSKIVRQSSETRNDLLEQDPAKEKQAEADKVSTTFEVSAEISQAAKAASESDSKHKPDLPLEKSEWETTEKEIPTGKPKVVHSPQQLSELPKALIDEEMVARTLEEAQESLNAAKNELKFIVKDGKSIKESPSEFEFRSISHTLLSAEKKEKVLIEEDIVPKVKQATVFSEEEDISSFIGIPDTVKESTNLITVEPAERSEGLFEATTKDTLNKEAVVTHYAQDIFEGVKQDIRDEHSSLGFVSTGTADDYSSMEEYAAKEEHASLGFVSTETVEDFSSMEDYYQEKIAKATIVTERSGPISRSPVEDTTHGSASVFSEISSEQTMKPFEEVTHRIKSETGSADATNRWSVPEIEQSSSSESYYRSLDKNDSRPLSSDVDNLLTQANSSEYQTALDVSSVTREATEYISAVSTLESSSGKTLSSHESMKSFDSQSDTSANLGSIDVSELSETLIASSTEADALEAEELAHIRDLRDDDEDSDNNLDIQDYKKTEQQIQRSLMKRSQEMIFKPKVEETKPEEKHFETVTVEEFPKPKEIEKSWGLAYPVDEGKIDDPKDFERPEDILLYHGDMRRSIDDPKLASSLDEGSILSVSMSSTSNIETVVENFEDMIGSAGSSSLTGIEGFAFPHDEQPSSFQEHEETFAMEMESREHSPQDSAATTPPGEARKRGHKRSESTSITGDVLKSITDKELPAVGENKESESESDTDPYESEYTRQFRSPNERKNNKKKKQAAAEMDHSFELEKRPFTPSQLVSEVIVEDSITEEMEAEAIEEERRPSQNMQDYSVIPDITVTEDFQKSPSLEENAEGFEEKSLYKVKTQDELHKAADEPLHQPKHMDKSEETFQKLVQEQYKQKLADLHRPQVGDSDYDDDKAPDSPDSFEMVDQPDISDDFVIIEEVAKEADEADLGGKSIKIQPTKYESKHDEDVEKIIIKSAPADPKLGSQIFRDDLNFEFEESPPTAGSSSDPQEESDSGDMASSNKRWVEMQLTDTQLRYPYDITGGVLEDIKEEDGEFEVGSSRISSFKDSFSSTPEYDVMAARRYYARGEHDDVSMSSLQEFESLEQAISLENRNKTHQGSTDSSNGSFTRRYMVRHSGSATAQGDDVSISSLKEFEGLENACIEAHLIEIKAKEEAAMLSRSDDSNKSNESDRENGASNVVVSKVTRTVTRTEVLPAQQHNIEALLKQKLEECEGRESAFKITELSTEPLEAKVKLNKQDSEKGSADSLEINKSLDMRSSSIGSFEISKDATTRSDIDSLETDRKQPTREESIDSMDNEQFDLLARFTAGETTLGEGLTTTTTTTTTTTDAEGHEHIVTQTVTTTTSGSGNATLDFPTEQIPKDASADSLCIEQTNTSSAGTTATYQTSAGNSQMSGSVTSCASSTLMEDSFPGANSSLTSSSFWSHEESTVVEDKNVLEEVLLEDAEALKRRQVQYRQEYDDQH
ncbi:uncharacterized protein LOC101456405 isoform X4 [Ceratitis capitata]|nr:uncharacterized protein LOC101456405 isoform X4 [Ceratitis capitata]